MHKNKKCKVSHQQFLLWDILLFSLSYAHHRSSYFLLKHAAARPVRIVDHKEKTCFCSSALLLLQTFVLFLIESCCVMHFYSTMIVR